MYLLFSTTKTGFSEYLSLYSSYSMKIKTDSFGLLCTRWQLCFHWTYYNF